jgi:hypothetical protein
MILLLFFVQKPNVEAAASMDREFKNNMAITLPK